MHTFDRSVPAVLLRIDQNPFHHGTLGAVRSLGRAGIGVHLVADRNAGPVVRSRYLSRTHPAPRGHDDENVLEALLRASERISRRAVLIPMDDLGALAAARLRGRLSGRFLLPEQCPQGLESVADKARLAGLCERYGIAHPTTVCPASAREAEVAARGLGLPVVAKWSRPWLLPPGAGLRSTRLLRTAPEAAELYERGARAGAGGALLLQRYLPAGPGRDWFFHGCAGPDGTVRAGGCGRKDRAWPVDAGLTAVGRWVPNPAVEDTARRLLAMVGHRGIADLDFRLDPASGAYHLLDFNPRPGAQFRLFADGSGLDVVRALHQDLTDRQAPPGRPRPGRRLVVENYALLSLLAAPAPRGAGPAHGTEAAWFAPDDPAPALAMTAAWGRHATRRAAAALFRRSGRRGA
ncbi:ATP-grasp domain-containing protein [Streptomyces sp. cg36]|uniref:carboxylate--amine ligase n=1 Tax=Streptomyces sp. cg36 TaxID=3238798 RepID=UPI0034E23722